MWQELGNFACEREMGNNEFSWSGLMDTSNIALWVSVCVRNMNVKDFALQLAVF